jgi:alpha-N-acetylglucosamine transferase
MFLLSMICDWMVEARNSSGGGGLRIFITHKYDRVDYLKFSLMINETMDELFQQFIKLITLGSCAEDKFGRVKMYSMYETNLM